MKKVLVLGAGLVSRPLVRYLLDQPDFQVTVASRTVSKAEALVAGHPDGTTLQLMADDNAKLEQLISEHDLAISLLPAPLHPVVAELCIRHKKHMVTTSYVSEKMKSFDGPARDARVMVLNEIGVDPGIDHMSAMRIIHDVAKRGGRVSSFKSYCGGLPAPEANDNPWGYKFSWSPRAVCTAGKNTGRFREDGQEVNIPGPRTIHMCSCGDRRRRRRTGSLSQPRFAWLHRSIWLRGYRHHVPRNSALSRLVRLPESSCRSGYARGITGHLFTGHDFRSLDRRFDRGRIAGRYSPTSGGSPQNGCRGECLRPNRVAWSVLG